MKKEPKLCADCPLSPAWRREAVKRLMENQYTREKEDRSALKICIERRKILAELGLKCPYFPETESIIYHTSQQYRQRIDRQNELHKRQNLTHFLLEE